MAVVVALSFGRDAHGWTWASGALLEDLMPWRWPRIMAALFAGVMLAVAGCIIQRLTGNPMASPEVLGISSGAAFGVVLMLFVAGNASLAVTCRQSRRGGDAAIIMIAPVWWILLQPYVTGGDGVKHRVHHALMIFARDGDRRPSRKC